jgi:lysophospholipase L1-like esterase
MRKRSLPIIVILTFFIAFSANAKTVKHPKPKKNTPVYYLSLGTSLAAGVQADPLTGESVVTDVSYPNILAAALGEDIRKLRHVNLGCPGENSDTFIDGGICDYPHGSQLYEAVKFLRAHKKFTGLITIDLGANDALACVDGIEIDIECFYDTVSRLSSNLAYVIQTLRKAAGPKVPIVGMNYYNPLLVYWFVDPDLAFQTAALQNILNDALLGVYDNFEIPMADVSSVFMSNNFNDDSGNGLPDNLDIICGWTWMCLWQNIHPNYFGYDAMAGAFEAVLPPIPVSKPPRRR